MVEQCCQQLASQAFLLMPQCVKDVFNARSRALLSVRCLSCVNSSLLGTQIQCPTREAVKAGRHHKAGEISVQTGLLLSWLFLSYLQGISSEVSLNIFLLLLSQKLAAIRVTLWVDWNARNDTWGKIYWKGQRAQLLLSIIPSQINSTSAAVYSILEKIQGVSRGCVTGEPYRQPDTDGGRPLMDHGLQRELGLARGARIKSQRSTWGRYTAPHSVDAGSWMVRSPKLGSRQLHCRLSLQALLSRDFLCSEIMLWSWAAHLHNKSLDMILKREREKWTKAMFLHLMSPICFSLKGAKTPQRHCQSA